ncbi:hypothetical protein [Paucidesulfovibrio longus]|uniref:hypothetical protein n=1 Tax=Paucidesulfovibrio longus TaxID=889 RepID=UPI0003B3844E|nr:hypothetical protein [Paucidesulfovibrio longus]
MNDAKYSILFMRDDLDVRRFRLNPFWLKSIFVSLTLLVLVAAAGIYFGATSLRDNLRLRHENKELSQRLDEAELRLSTLGNMEKILESYDTKELQSLLSPEKAETPEAEAKPTAPSEPAKPAVDLSSIFAKTDTGAVRLEDVRLEIEQKQVLVSFNLLNNLGNTQLSGDTRLALVANNGEVIELPAKNADLSFQIQRRKPIRARVPLPDGLDRANVFGLRLTVTREDGKVVFSETYPQYRVD